MYPIHIKKFLFFGDLVYFYEGFYFSLAVMIAYLIGLRFAKKYGVSNHDYNGAVIGALICGILGGKIFHQVFYREGFTTDHLWRIISLSSGGLSITGAVVLGPLLTYLYCKLRGFDYWKIFAIVVPAIIAGQSIGRVGCFLNGDAHGVKTESVFGVQFAKNGHVAVDGFKELNDNKHVTDAFEYSLKNGYVGTYAQKSASLHPAQLYEAFANLLLLGITIFLLRLSFNKNRDIRLTPFAYVGGYAIIRFFLEFVRADRMMTNNQYLSDMQQLLLTTFVVSTGIVVYLYYNGKRTIYKTT